MQARPCSWRRMRNRRIDRATTDARSHGPRPAPIQSEAAPQVGTCKREHMCHYITASLPGSADHAALDALARGYGRQFKPLSNPDIEAQLQPGERYFITTLGHCDCGTPLGALAQGSRRSPDWTAWSSASSARDGARQRSPGPLPRSRKTFARPRRLRRRQPGGRVFVAGVHRCSPRLRQDVAAGPPCPHVQRAPR